MAYGDMAQKQSTYIAFAGSGVDAQHQRERMFILSENGKEEKNQDTEHVSSRQSSLNASCPRKHRICLQP